MFVEAFGGLKRRFAEYIKRGSDMSTGKGCKLLMIVILSLMVTMAAVLNSYAEEEKTMVGTLSAQMDSEKKTVTVMFVGYTEGSPVIIGPTSWEISEQEFSKATAEDIGKKLCGQDHSFKKVTKFINTGKEIVAEVVIKSEKAPVIVGR